MAKNRQPNPAKNPNRLPFWGRVAKHILAWYDFAEPFNATGGRKRRPPNIEYQPEEGPTQLNPTRRLLGVDLARNMERNDAPTHGLVRQLRANVVGDAGKLQFSESGGWYDKAGAYFKSWSRHADFVDATSWRECLQLAVYALAMEGDFVALYDDGWLSHTDGLGTGRLLFFEADQICNLDAESWASFARGPRRRWTQCSGILLDGYGRRAGIVVSKHRGRTETPAADAFVLTCDPERPDEARWRFVSRKFRLRQLRGVADAIPALTTAQDAAEMQGYELQTAKRAASHYALVRLRPEEVTSEDVSALPPPATIAAQTQTDNTSSGTANAANAATAAANAANAAQSPAATDAPMDNPVANLTKITGGQLDASADVEGIDWDPASRPSGAVTDFLEFATRLAGRAHGLNSSYALGRADGSYSAARMDLVMSWVVLTDNQQFLEDSFADWVAVRVLERAVALDELDPPPADWKTKIHWTWPTMPSIDEQKEQAALTQKLRNGVQTPQSVIGPGWREVIDQRAEFDAYCRQKGVTLAFQETTPGATAAAEQQNGSTENEENENG